MKQFEKRFAKGYQFDFILPRQSSFNKTLKWSPFLFSGSLFWQLL
jgi:hypothetical protein